MEGALAAGITAVAGLAASSASNSSNKEIASNANAFNERMLDKQIQYNNEMYERQLQDNLKYSDPSYIRDRLQMAGYNPSLVGTENVGAAVSSPQVQGINPPRAQTYQADYRVASNAGGQAFQLAQNAKSVDAEADYKKSLAEQVKVDLQTQQQMNMAKLANLIENTNNVRLRNAYQDTMNRWQDRFNEIDYSLRTSTEKQIIAQTEGQLISNNINSVNLQWLPMEKRLACSNVMADTAVKYATKELTESEVVTEGARACLMYAQEQNEGLAYQFGVASFDQRLDNLASEFARNVSSALNDISNPLVSMSEGSRNRKSREQMNRDNNATKRFTEKVKAEARKMMKSFKPAGRRPVTPI